MNVKRKDGSSSDKSWLAWELSQLCEKAFAFSPAPQGQHHRRASGCDHVRWWRTIVDTHTQWFGVLLLLTSWCYYLIMVNECQEKRHEQPGQIDPFLRAFSTLRESFRILSITTGSAFALAPTSTSINCWYANIMVRSSSSLSFNFMMLLSHNRLRKASKKIRALSILMLTL